MTLYGKLCRKLAHTLLATSSYRFEFNDREEASAEICFAFWKHVRVSKAKEVWLEGLELGVVWFRSRETGEKWGWLATRFLCVRLRRSTVFARSANHEHRKAKTMRNYCEFQIQTNSKMSVDTCLRKPVYLASYLASYLDSCLASYLTCVYFVILPPRDQYLISINFCAWKTCPIPYYRSESTSSIVTGLRSQIDATFANFTILNSLWLAPYWPLTFDTFHPQHNLESLIQDFSLTIISIITTSNAHINNILYHFTIPAFFTQVSHSTPSLIPLSSKRGLRIING